MEAKLLGVASPPALIPFSSKCSRGKFPFPRECWRKSCWGAHFVASTNPKQGGIASVQALATPIDLLNRERVDESESYTLEGIRSSLIRQEDSIIFSLMERAQFCYNALTYSPDAFSIDGLQGSLAEYMVKETEKLHARFGRYKSPDEHPFFPSDLPGPMLPPMQYPQVLHPAADSINVNVKIWEVYFKNLLPRLVKDGDDGNYGSSAVCDTLCLQVLSKRIHYGKFVAEAKFQALPEAFIDAIKSQSPFGMSHQQALAHVTAQAAFSQSLTQMQADYYQCSSAASSVEVAETQPEPSLIPITLQQKGQGDNTSLEVVPHSLQIVEEDSSHFDKKPASSYAGDKPVDDGYNWRKYGQKLVKDKEHPRSYYRCTYLGCPVKKKVERGADGHIAEITYKGHHNHDVPQRNVRAKDGNHQASLEKPNPIAQNQMEILDEDHTSQSHLVKQELPAQLPAVQVYINSEHDETEDSAVVIDEDNYDDELNAKKRNTEFGEGVSAPPLKTVTEPKIVVQTRSEVDLLDDGFKWRKYGQKIVKGSSYPRSYYRCTYSGCNVRKHVERASTDPKAVITTYEGKHDHDIPIAKGGGGGGGGHNNTDRPSKLRKTNA